MANATAADPRPVKVSVALVSGFYRFRLRRFIGLRRFGGARFSASKLWNFMCAVGFIVSTWLCRFTGFGDQLGSISTFFLLFLTPFGCHLGSILASFWHLFEPWRPFGLHFGSIWSPGGPLGRSRGPLGRIWGFAPPLLGPKMKPKMLPK